MNKYEKLDASYIILIFAYCFTIFIIFKFYYKPKLFYGFDSGFKYYEQSYSEDYREEICTRSGGCIKIIAQTQIPYSYFKKKRLCTSKRTD